MSEQAASIHSKLIDAVVDLGLIDLLEVRATSQKVGKIPFSELDGEVLVAEAHNRFTISIDARGFIEIKAEGINGAKEFVSVVKLIDSVAESAKNEIVAQIAANV